MQSIQIKTPHPEEARSLITHALETEKKLTRDSLATTNARITNLLAHLKVDVNAIMTGTVPRTEDNEVGLLELEGELAIRKILEETLQNLEALEVCH